MVLVSTGVSWIVEDKKVVGLGLKGFEVTTRNDWKRSGTFMSYSRRGVSRTCQDVSWPLPFFNMHSLGCDTQEVVFCKGETGS